MSRARSRKGSALASAIRGVRAERDEDVPPAITAHVLNEMAAAKLDAKGNFELAAADVIKALVARGYSLRASEDAMLMIGTFPGPAVCRHH